jgi:hypothetical protein
MGYRISFSAHGRTIGDMRLRRPMNVSTVTDVSLLDSHQAEWRVLRTHWHNVLIEGSPAASDAVLHLLRPHIRAPIVSIGPHDSFKVPSGETRSLFLRAPDALSRDDQARLLEWLEGDCSGTQIISTTEAPLFSLVREGCFDAALYYRLNAILIRVGSRMPPDFRTPGGCRDDQRRTFRCDRATVNVDVTRS